MSRRASFWNPPFPEKLLFDSEVVVVDLKPHWWVFSKPLLGILVTVGVLIWASTWDQSNFAETWGALVLAGISVVCLGWLGVRWLKWRSMHFVVTSDRVIHRSGVFLKKGVAIPLERVNNINFQQSLFERIIGAGDLHIESAGEDGQQNFYDIRRPDEVQNLIHSQIDRGDFRSPSSSVQYSDRSAQLERLEALRDRGTLTQEEFEREKRRILDVE